MTLAMAAVGDLVSPRERGRYQGYIAATFAVATVVGPLLGGAARRAARAGAGSSTSTCRSAPLRWSACTCACRRRDRAAPEHPLDALGAALLAAATSALMLTCIWGGDALRVGLGRRSSAWSAPRIALVGGAGRARAARAPTRSSRSHLLRTRTVAVASAALFLATAALFAITVFVPLFLQADDGRDARREAGLLLVPAMLGITRLDHACRAGASRAPAATSASRSPGSR